MTSKLEKWRYIVPTPDQPKLWSLLEALEKLRDRGLTVAMVIMSFHRQRVLPLMAQWQRLDQMTSGEPIEGIRMSATTLTTDDILRRVRETVAGGPSEADLFTVAMHPSWGHVSMVSQVLL